MVQLHSVHARQTISPEHVALPRGQSEGSHPRTAGFRREEVQRGRSRMPPESRSYGNGQRWLPVEFQQTAEKPQRNHE